MGFGVSDSPVPDQWGAYLQAAVDIQVGGRIIRILPDAAGQVSGDFPDPSGRTIHVITAANPYGRPASDEDNERSHRELLRELRVLNVDRMFPAVGGDPAGSHAEQSVAVVGLSDAAAVELGRRFEQDAVFAWTPQSLTLLSCVSDIEAVRGWCQHEVPDEH
jgi:hypothetical protein